MNIEKRTLNADKIRLQKMIPGVVYGKAFESLSIQVPSSDFIRYFHEYGTSKTFPITLDGDKHIVYIKDVQYDTMDIHKVLHFDFIKVSAKDTITSRVSLSYHGKELFNKGGQVLNIVRDDIEIEYKVGKGVASIDVDLSGLTEETPIHVSDIVVPKGVKVITRGTKLVASLTTASSIEVAETEEAKTETVYDTGE